MFLFHRAGRLALQIAGLQVFEDDAQPIVTVCGVTAAEARPEFHRHVLGAQGQLWTEYIVTNDHLEYMAFPRLAALAEVVWSREDKDYHDFLARLKLNLERLQAFGLGYRPLDRAV